MNKNTKMTKAPKGGTERNVVSGTSQNNTAIVNESNEKDKSTSSHKIAPTAEQLRIAQMIDNTHSEKQLQEKIHQVTQVTGVSTDDAMIALHDCNHDVSAAIDALLEGENQGEWKESTKKKKKSTTKGKENKEDNESNKENRRSDNRERGSSKTRGTGPRFRGRGGRGGTQREDNSDTNLGRSSNRKGRMVNGSAGSYRGRGSRGRGSNHRTFQTKQPLGFTETIDTWGEPPLEKVDDVNSMQIDTWGEEPVHVAAAEDWGDGEWTGSLEHTTVFGPSTSSMSPNPNSSLNASENSQKSVPGLSDDLVQASTITSLQEGSLRNEDNSESINMLMGQRQTPTKQLPIKGANTYGATSEPMGLAALLQKATPHTSLERILTPGAIDNSTMAQSNLRTNPQNNLLSNLANSMEESMKTAYSAGGSPAPHSAASSKPYSTSGSSIFTNPNARSPNLASINENAISKALGLVSQSSNMTLRSAKQPARKNPVSTSKIPLSAVEMPEEAMAALDIQMAGLEFGAEAAFDFTNDSKPNSASNMVSAVPNRDLVTGCGPGMNTGAIQQSQPGLGPEPIPFPTQGGERKTTGGSLLTNQRVPPASQSYAELKKDNTNSLSGLVGSATAAPYQPSSSYNAKPTSTSFPSPPSTHFAQSQAYSSSNNTGGVANSYPGSVNNKASNNSIPNQTGVTSYSSSFPSHTSVSSPYQNNYASSTSHSNLSSINVPGLKDQTQQIQSYNESSATSLPGSLSTNVSSVASNSGPNTLASLSSSASSAQSTKPSTAGKPNNVSNSIPPGVQHLPNHSQQQIMHHALGQAPHHQIQQQLGPQQTQMVTGHGQYVSPAPAALQGTLPPTFYNVQQPAMYSYEDLQMFQRGIPHLAPTSLPGARDGSITSPSAYSASDGGKFRTDQNSSPVPSTISQQAANAGGTYITAAGNAAMPPFYMYHNMAIQNSFPQYGHPAIIQLPPNTHTGSTTTQFPGPPKIPYGGTSNYYDSMSQSQDYKSGYGAASQGQNKSGTNSVGSANNPGSDLSSYKNHFNKVGRSYDKQGFHSGTPPPFGLTGSGSNPMAANAYGPAMFFSTVPAAQHHSPLVHHQLHQDGTNANNQRGGVGSSQNKAASKSGYSGSYWGSN